jgi:hypothetical protein
MRTHRLTAIALLLVLALGMATVAAAKLDLGGLLKVGGIAFLVTQYGEKINSVIDGALGERDAAAAGATKVVPILSVGEGGYIGAAQVVGSPENVQRVKAVFQVEIQVASFRAKALIPAETSKAKTTPERAKGVGVSAVVEFKI